MEKWEEDIFSFLTEKEHFESLIKIAPYYEKVKKELLSQFWEAVYQKIQAFVKSKDGWQVSKPNDIFERNAHILLYKNSWVPQGEWASISLGWEWLTFSKPFFCLLINHDSKVLDIEKAMREGELLINMVNEKFNFELEGNYGWWAFWQYAEIDFNTDTEFIKILPDNRELLIDSFSNTIINLANFLEKDLDRIAQLKAEATSHSPEN
jgi:hypothetical protein